MKKIKIMLMVTLVVAAVGGALAFKAAKIKKTYFCGTTPNSCLIQFDNYTTEGDSFYDLHCSIVPGTNCPLAITDNQ